MGELTKEKKEPDCQPKGVVGAKFYWDEEPCTDC